VIKSKKIAEIAFPRETEAALEKQFGYGSRKVAAARREWLAAKVAEIKAQPNRDAKVVGTGSYQRVSVYEVAEVASRIQYRGTCQVCGGQQAVVDGRLALHGYSRPGWGYTVGRCWGSHEQPAEVSIVLATETRETLLRGAAERRETQKALAQRGAREGVYEPTKYGEGRDAQGRRIPLPPAQQSIQWQYNEAGSRASQLQQHANFIAEYILPRHGQALYEVAVAE
jgi:hypothetical protein